MSRRTAHILGEKWRSDDIRIGEDADFSSLLLPKELLRGLSAAGYKYPSPIQLKAIPVGKIGKDLIVQAKSGTGKTLVFTVVALNMLLKGATHPQVLIMAPTWEVAYQISTVIKCVAVSYKGLACEHFIGGCRLEDDIPRIQGCQIIVGTPGRIKQLISYKILKTAGIRLFVLDEADQLLRESSFITDIDDIFRALPRDKQMIATSATYPERLKKLTNKYFRQPLLIRLNMKDIGLLGMVHYFRIIPVSKLPVVAYKEKLKVLEKVLLSVKFAQCLVFCNMVSRVENLCVEIKNWGFATSFISSAREQEDRLKAIELLKKFKCKVLVSSDVSSRGIDAENVDLVINFDLPSQLDTYFHRVGRAGRYGSKCASVSFITSDEIEAYDQMQSIGRFKSYHLPDLVPKNLISLRPKNKSNAANEELPSDDETESSSDDSSEEDINENGVVKPKKSDDFSEGSELNGHKELSCTSKVEDFASENSTKSSDENLVDVEIASAESKDSLEMQFHSLDSNSNPTNSVKEDDDSCSTFGSLDLESENINLPTSVQIKQPEVVTEVSSSPEIVEVEDKNGLEVDSSNGEESEVEKKSAQNLVMLVEENTENCLSKSNTGTSNTHGFQQITATTSCPVNLENDANTVDSKSSVTSNGFNTSKSMNPNPNELSSFITYIEKYEKWNKEMEEFSKSLHPIDEEQNVSKFSPESLKHFRSSLGRFHYHVCKDLVTNSSENLRNETVKGCRKDKSAIALEKEEQVCLKQNGENAIQKSCLDSHPTLFSTPKAEVISTVKSSDSSGVESSSETGKDKLIEHFNLKLASIRKVKPDKNSTSDSSSASETKSDISVSSEDAMHVLTKEFNKVSKERIKYFSKKTANINNAESSSTSSDSDSGTSIDSENVTDELEQRFTELIKTKKSDKGPSKDVEETKKILREIQSTKKGFKGIEIVDTKIHAESSTSSSDSDTSTDSGSTKKEPLIEWNKNVKSKVLSTRKSSESSNCRTKVLNGCAVDKITDSETESDASSEKSSGLHDGLERKTCIKGKSASKTVPSYKTSSSETENSIDRYSTESGSSLQSFRQSKRKNRKRDETLPETGPSPFDYSSANVSSNPWNRANERPYYYSPHYNSQMQPSYASPYNGQHSHQRQSHADERPFSRAHSSYQMQPTYPPNPYYPSYPQQTHSQANGQYLNMQSSHHTQPAYVPNSLNRNECPLVESCPISRMRLGSEHAGTGHTARYSIGNSRRNSNASTNVRSNHVTQPLHNAYHQCITPSQHPCHPPNEICQSPACAAWYDIFYKQWQFINQAPHF